MGPWERFWKDINIVDGIIISLDLLLLEVLQAFPANRLFESAPVGNIVAEQSVDRVFNETLEREMARLTRLVNAR